MLQHIQRGVAIAARLVENASSHNHSAVLLASKLKGVEGYWRGLCGGPPSKDAEQYPTRQRA